MRAISTSERAINRISKRTDGVRTGSSEHSPRPRPELLAAAADQLEPNRQPHPRHDQQSCQRLRHNQKRLRHNQIGTHPLRDYRVRLPSDRLALYTGRADRSRPTIEEHQMADNRLSEKFDALSDKAKESANKLKAAGGREKDQLKADAAAARERATATADQFEEKVVDASDRASSQWDEVRGKWKAHLAKVQSSIEAKIDEQDAKAAALDADLAEDYALDAIS